MDRPNNLMVIDSVMWCDGPVDLARLKRVIQTRLVDVYPVFRQRLVGSTSLLGLPQWEDDPDFRLSRHMHRTTLAAPGGEAELQRFIERHMHRELDREHPLWQVFLVDGYQQGSAVVTRFHHALADGIALSQVLLSMTDATDTADLEEQPTEGGSEQGHRPSVVGMAAHGVRSAVNLVSGFPRIARPSVLIDALTLAQQTGHIADKLLLGSNPLTPLSGEPGIHKRAVWSNPRPVADVKRIGRLAGATVNDVLVGAVSGAISSYLVSHGGEATDLTTMVPVNLRPEGEPLPRELGNRFALVLLPLATGARAPLDRLAETKRRMDSIKHSPEAVITFGIINALGRTNPGIERFLVDFFSSKAIGVTTNVMGPLTDRFVAGARIVGVLGWVPGSGRQSVGVCIFSYNQVVRVGFKVDASIVPDPELLVDAFDQEMDDLLRMARAV